jgi:hypothetical protein
MKLVNILVTWIFLAAMIAANALANILPINQLNTGQISAFYPNYFVPAGFTFSIWGIIYLLLINYTISYTYFTVLSDKFPKVAAYLSVINKWFWVTCFLNASWILAWHYLWIWTSVLIMLLFLSTLIYIFIKGKEKENLLNKTQSFLLYTPFLVYLGWISVATIANITALLVKIDWNGFGISPVTWSLLMMITATILAIYFIWVERTTSYSLVIMWALWGIRAARTDDAPFLSQAALVGLVLIFITLVSALWIAKRNKPLND